MSRKHGFTFAVRLRSDRVVFSFLGILPLYRVDIDDIEYLRVSSMNEYFEAMRSGESVRYWPSFITGYAKRLAPVYVIKVKSSDEKVFVRLRSGFHYLLRTAIGREKSNNHSSYPKW